MHAFDPPRLTPQDFSALKKGVFNTDNAKDRFDEIPNLNRQSQRFRSVFINLQIRTEGMVRAFTLKAYLEAQPDYDDRNPIRPSSIDSLPRRTFPGFSPLV